MTRTPQDNSAATNPDGLHGVVRSLRWARLQLIFRAEDTLHLPAYAGSTFRGGIRLRLQARGLPPAAGV